MLDFLLVITADRSRRPGWLLRAPLAAGVAAGMLCSSGCLFQKKQARVFVPPPPQPVAKVVVSPPPITAGPNIAVKPGDPPELDAVLGSRIVELPPPPAPAPPPRRPPVVTRTPPPPPAPEPAPPKIVQIFTPEQRRDYNRTLDDSLNRVQRALEVLARRSLTAEQRDTMAQIQDFLNQARQAREQDLVTAVNLAKHADGLAKDLLDRLP